jgi:hypothetical protein
MVVIILKFPIMKKIIVKIFALLSLVAAFVGCQKDETNPELAKVTGQWHYNNGQTGATLVDVYLVFNADNSFELYQKLGEGAYRKYTGTFAIENNLLSGKYSDGTPWAAAYTVKNDGGFLYLTSNVVTEHMMRCVKKEVPADILNHYDDDTKADASETPVL